MTPELLSLSLAVLLQGVQTVLYGALAQKQLGSAYVASARDEPRSLTGRAGRAQRALNNHFESLVLFTPAVLVITLSENGSTFTAACAWIYLVARILYVPAYLLGWVPGRSQIWFAGFLATFVMLISALI